MTTRNLAFLFSFFNLVGVVPLLGLAGVYRPNRYDEWIASVQEFPMRHSLSGVLFTIGVFCGVALGVHLLVTYKEHFWTGFLLATGSTLNGLTTTFPFILAQMTFDKEVGIVMLATALLADSAYNLFLGLAMITEGLILKAGEYSKLGWAGIIIGIVTLPVAIQCTVEGGALWLGVAGPSWIVWWVIWGYHSPNVLHHE